MQQIKRKMKREIKAEGLTHKLPLTHKTQFSFTTQEECNLAFYFFLLRQNVEIICYFSVIYCYGVSLGTKSIIIFRIVCFSCVEQQKVPATVEITG